MAPARVLILRDRVWFIWLTEGEGVPGGKSLWARLGWALTALLPVRDLRLLQELPSDAERNSRTDTAENGAGGGLFQRQRF